MNEDKPDPILSLIDFFNQELLEEIIHNNDSTKFWNRFVENVISMPLSSFREAMVEFYNYMGTDKGMFNYFSGLCFRVYSQPFTDEALKGFASSFNTVCDDAFLKPVFGYTTRDITVTQVLLLFFAVHSNKITIAITQAIHLRTTQEKKDKRGSR